MLELGEERVERGAPVLSVRRGERVDVGETGLGMRGQNDTGLLRKPGRTIGAWQTLEVSIEHDELIQDAARVAPVGEEEVEYQRHLEHAEVSGAIRDRAVGDLE